MNGTHFKLHQELQTVLGMRSPISAWSVAFIRPFVNLQGAPNSSKS